jgi:hypothetical protein
LTSINNTGIKTAMMVQAIGVLRTLLSVARGKKEGLLMNVNATSSDAVVAAKEKCGIA